MEIGHFFGTWGLNAFQIHPNYRIIGASQQVDFKLFFGLIVCIFGENWLFCIEANFIREWGFFTFFWSYFLWYPFKWKAKPVCLHLIRKPGILSFILTRLLPLLPSIIKTLSTNPTSYRSSIFWEKRYMRLLQRIKKQSSISLIFFGVFIFFN